MKKITNLDKELIVFMCGYKAGVLRIVAELKPGESGVFEDRLMPFSEAVNIKVEIEEIE